MSLSDTAIAKWQECDLTLVAMLNEVVSKANECMQDPDVKAAATDYVFVDDASRQLDPAWCWLLDIVVTLTGAATGEYVEWDPRQPETVPWNIEPALEAMRNALQAPSRLATLEAYESGKAAFAP